MKWPGNSCYVSIFLSASLLVQLLKLCLVWLNDVKKIDCLKK